MILHPAVVLAAVGLVTWGFEVRARRAFAATLSPVEKRQFRAYCRVNPSWRAYMSFKQAERDHADQLARADEVTE